MSAYQLLTPALALVVIASLVSRRRRGEIGKPAFFLGLFIWVGAAAGSLFPDQIMGLLGFMGIIDRVRILIFFGFMVLFFAVYRLILQVEKLDHQVTTLTRELAVGRYLQAEAGGGAQAAAPHGTPQG